jgi:hypothetical protein
MLAHPGTDEEASLEPLLHCLISTATQFVIFASFIYYQGRDINSLQQFIVVIPAYEDSLVKQLDLVSIAISFILGLDLFLDVSGHFFSQHPSAADIHAVNRFPRCSFRLQLNDWVLRAMFVSIFFVYSAVSYCVKKDGTKMLYTMSLGLLINSTAVCMMMFVYSNAFDRTRKDYLFSYAVSGTFALGTLLMNFMLLSEFSPAVVLTWHYIGLSLDFAVIIFIYYRIFKSSYYVMMTTKTGEGVFTLAQQHQSQRQRIFVLYAFIFVICSVGVITAHGLANFGYKDWSIHAEALKQISILLYAGFAILLPARISRQETKRAMLMLEIVEQQAVIILDTSLNIASTELELLLSCERASAQRDESKIKSLQRIDAACRMATRGLRRS